MKKFSIVEFPIERTVDVVPTSWVEADECWWPPLGQKRLLEDKEAIPNKKSWTKHKSRVIKSYDTYKEALRKMKKGKYTLSFDTSAQEESCEDDSLCLDSECETPELVQIRLPNYDLLNTTKRNDLELDTEKLLTERNETKKWENFEAKFIRFSEVVLRKIEKLSDDIKEIKENTAMCGSLTVPEETDANIVNLPTLPISSVDALYEMQDWLQDSRNMQAMITFLANKGGGNVKSMTRRLLHCCVTNAVASAVNWTGKFGKFPFRDHRLVQALMSAVQQTYSCTENEIEAIMKNWVRFAKDRDGGREARRQKSVL